MAFVEPEYQGVKEKRKKERGDSKEKNTMKIPFIVPSPLPLHSDTVTQVAFFMDFPSVKCELSYKTVYGLWKNSLPRRRFERERERNLGARHLARARMEKENLSSFLARPSCSSHDRNPLSLPFRTPARVRMTRRACPTLYGDRIRLLCFGFSTLSHLSNFRFLWRRWLRCFQSALWRLCFVTGIRKCRTYSDMWRTYQQNGWPSIVRGTASDWSMVFVSRRVVKMYYSEVAFQGICWTDTLHLN